MREFKIAGHHARTMASVHAPRADVTCAFHSAANDAAAARADARRPWVLTHSKCCAAGLVGPVDQPRQQRPACRPDGAGRHAAALRQTRARRALRARRPPPARAHSTARRRRRHTGRAPPETANHTRGLLHRLPYARPHPPGPPLPSSLVADRVDVHRQLDKAVRVAPLVVVPRDELDKVAREHDARARVEDGRARVVHEVLRDDLVLRVAHDALVLGRLALGLDDLLDLVVRRLLGEAAGEVDDRHVGRGHAEGHARQLAVERGQHLAHGLGRARRRRDDVLPGAAPAAPVLARRAVHRLLRRRRRVHGGHEALDDAELLVDDLGEGREAVGRARRVGEDVDVLGVRRMVHAHHEHGRVGGRRRDDHLLRAALEVRGGLVDDGEDARRLAHDVRAGLAPRHLVGRLGRVELDLLAVDDQDVVGLIALHGAGEPAVRRVVLEEVRGILHVAERVVHRDDLDALALARGAADEAADAAKAGDAHLGRHGVW
mmetsp:Transcript_18044/g.56190  ORF Transcript_18044/g.56190 Transcript_18044/m.56190 type:complete len:490 (-) Transcript_18044:63-1532(-)